MIPSKIGNFRFLAKIDIYVNSATEFAHLGHFATEIRTFLKFWAQMLLIFERSGNFETKFTHKCSATKNHSFLEFSRSKICTFHIFEKFLQNFWITLIYTFIRDLRVPFFLFMTTPTTIDTDTELSAVNSILGAIGQSPITTTLNFENPEICLLYTSPSPRDSWAARVP